jgi:uncharacterized membrane protein YhaH (DUF805 family)
MSFADAIRSCFAQFATFSGRARRSEYWWFSQFSILAGFVGIVVLALISGIVGSILPDSVSGAFTALVSLVAVVGYFMLVIPGLAVFSRRMHDTGRSAWWLLLCVVPFGGIVLLVFACSDSQPDNRYGPSPKSRAEGYLGSHPGGYPGQAYPGVQPAYGLVPYGPVVPGQLVPGQVLPGQPPFNQSPYGQPRPGQAPYGQPPSDQAYGQPRPSPPQ